MKAKLLTLLVAFWLLPLFASAEQILLFVSLVRVNPEGQLLVTETIQYDFGEGERHGIFRTIPYLYESARGKVKADITDIAVVRADGVAVPWELSRASGYVTIKIGDPNATVTGVQAYRISYQVDDAILFLDDRDELYWNATGNEWAVPIRDARSMVTFGIPGATIEQAACYQGEYGSQRECEASRFTEDMRSFEAGQRGLKANQGLSVAVAVPKGVIPEPTVVSRLLEWLLVNWIVLLPLSVVCGMAYLWHTRGRDPRGRGTIVRQYDPPEDLSPLAVGLLYDERAHKKDVTALIVDLAVKGYLKIHQFERSLLIFSTTDYLLERLQTEDDELDAIERKVLARLFTVGKVTTETIHGKEVKGVVLSSLAHKLTTLYNDVADDINEELTKAGYFVANPMKVRQRYMGAGGAGGFLMIWLVALLGLSYSFIVYAMIGLAALSVVVFGYFMPQRTKKGVALREHILGFKEYLGQAEKERLAFHNDPERTPERFDTLLPFAMVLGVEKAWAKQFEDAYQGGAEMGPRWFDGGGARFQPAVFATNLSAFSGAMSTAATPKSSSGGGGASGGGGFSGGGFGGGGGGSW